MHKGTAYHQAGTRKRAFALTKREHEVRQHILEGLSNPEIAKRLSITHHTVQRHVSTIFEKLEVKSRLELVVVTMRSKPGGYLRAYRCGGCGELLEAGVDGPAQFRVKCSAEGGLAYDLQQVCEPCKGKLLAAIEAELERLKLPATPDQP